MSGESSVAIVTIDQKILFLSRYVDSHNNSFTFSTMGP